MGIMYLGFDVPFFVNSELFPGYKTNKLLVVVSLQLLLLLVDLNRDEDDEEMTLMRLLTGCQFIAPVVVILTWVMSFF